MNQIRSNIVSGLPIAALLLLAIAPVVEKTEWLYELVMIASGCLFILFFLAVFLLCKKEGAGSGIAFWVGGKWVEWSCIAVSLVGFVIDIWICGVFSYFWCLVLIVSLLAIFFPLKRKK